MTYYARGGETERISDEELKAGLKEALEKLGHRRKVIAVPPDITRLHSRSGTLTAGAYEYYGRSLTDVMPALGTHVPMSGSERRLMYPEIPGELFRVHDWTRDLATLGEVPAEEIRRLSEGKLDFTWPAQVNSRLLWGEYDLILSIGQVVPHEVIGMANYNKNIFVGTGGREGINKSHYLGAVYGMERIMGRADNPVRELMNYASEHFAADLPILYVLTVVGRDEHGELAVKGLYIGDDAECFYRAAELSKKVNTTRTEKPLPKVVVRLDPEEFKSTWLGNKAIYRTRMAIADGGELIVLAPGVQRFGENEIADGLIRKYGYAGTERVLAYVDRREDLRDNLGTAAHLIHGSSEGRFTIRYCPGALAREEVEGVGFEYGDYESYSRRYDPRSLREGWNRLDDGEELYYISNPAVGLWYGPGRDID
jgi:nickel-dependent lactate racemase